MTTEIIIFVCGYVYTGLILLDLKGRLAGFTSLPELLQESIAAGGRYHQSQAFMADYFHQVCGRCRQANSTVDE